MTRKMLRGELLRMYCRHPHYIPPNALGNGPPQVFRHLDHRPTPCERAFTLWWRHFRLTPDRCAYRNLNQARRREIFNHAEEEISKLLTVSWSEFHPRLRTRLCTYSSLFREKISIAPPTNTCVPTPALSHELFRPLPSPNAMTPPTVAAESFGQVCCLARVQDGRGSRDWMSPTTAEPTRAATYLKWVTSGGGSCVWVRLCM